MGAAVEGVTGGSGTSGSEITGGSTGTSISTGGAGVKTNGPTTSSPFTLSGSQTSQLSMPSVISHHHAPLTHCGPSTAWNMRSAGNSAIGVASPGAAYSGAVLPGSTMP